MYVSTRDQSKLGPRFALGPRGVTNETLERAALLCAIFIFFSVPGKTQVATSTISTTMADATGGMVPGAAIRVTNNGTGR